MNFAVVFAVFPLIFFGELPDKTMFASLVLASRGRPLAVWCGSAGAFVVHVAIAVTVGVGLFHLLPDRGVDLVVAALFGLGAYLAFNATEEGEEEEAEELVGPARLSPHRVALTAFGVIFVAEWGDLTQLATAALCAKYGNPITIAIAAILALWAVTALAVVLGSQLKALVRLELLNATAAVVLAVVGILLIGRYR